MAGSSVIRAHQHAAGGQENQAPGRSAGGFSAEIHAPAGAPGYPVNIRLTAGQAHDGVPAEELPGNQPAEYAAADKAYGSEGPVSFIISKGSVPVIPSRRNRKEPRGYDRHIFRERHPAEIFFNKIKHRRRTASLYEKPAAGFLTVVLIACCMIRIGF